MYKAYTIDKIISIFIPNLVQQRIPSTKFLIIHNKCERERERERCKVCDNIKMTILRFIFTGHLFSIIHIGKWFTCVMVTHHHVGLHSFMHVMSKWGVEMVCKLSQSHQNFRLNWYENLLHASCKKAPVQSLTRWSHYCGTQQPPLFLFRMGPVFVIQTVKLIYWTNKLQDITADYI